MARGASKLCQNQKTFWILFISPQSERSELGAFYFCPGVLSDYCCVCESGYCNWVCYRGSSEMCQIHTQWSHFSRLMVTVDFDDCFSTKLWSVDHIIIVIYINGVCYRRSSEMSQIHVQWSHFLTAIGYCWFGWCFITKVWSVDHIIIVIYINGLCYRGSSEKWQIHMQWWHFSRLLVTVDFDDSFDTKYGQLINENLF